MGKENDTPILKGIFESLIPAIECIDGGCKSCISDFCDVVNDDIEKYGYKFEHSEDYPVTVKLSEL